MNGQWIDVFKDPITDKGKQSKRGRMTLLQHQEYGTFKTVSIDPEVNSIDLMVKPIGFEDALVTVFENGKLVVDHTFAKVRERANRSRL